MALPIRPTPELRGKAAEDFERKVSEGLKRPLKVSTPPSLDRARKAVFEGAKLFQK